MKIIMTLLVRDEQDIIKKNLDFHLAQGVDFFIVTDNKSVDSTKEILKEYIDRGLVYYIFEDGDDYNQHEWVTRMARMAYVDFAADWVINNDADEFWWPIEGDLKDTFNKISSDFNMLEAERYNFVAMDNHEKTLFYKKMIYREVVSLNPLGMPLPPKVAHRGNEKVMVKQGNHSVIGMESINTISEVVVIFHFPLRTYSQFCNKIIMGGAAYERNTSLPKAIGGTWRKLYDEYKLNNNLTDYYKKHSYSKEKIAKELEEKIILKDTRLLDYFDEIGIS